MTTDPERLAKHNLARARYARRELERLLLTMRECEVREEEAHQPAPVGHLHALDAWLCRSGKHDDHEGSRARDFWQTVCEDGKGVYYVSDGGYSRLCANVWNRDRDVPVLGLDRGLSLPFALARWEALA